MLNNIKATLANIWNRYSDWVIITLLIAVGGLFFYQTIQSKGQDVERLVEPFVDQAIPKRGTFQNPMGEGEAAAIVEELMERPQPLVYNVIRQQLPVVPVEEKINRRSRAERLYQEGEQAYNDRQLTEAIQKMQAVLEIDPDQVLLSYPSKPRDWIRNIQRELSVDKRQTLLQQAVQAQRQAQDREAVGDLVSALENYERAYQAYEELVELIDLDEGMETDPQIQQARAQLPAVRAKYEQLNKETLLKSFQDLIEQARVSHSQGSLSRAVELIEQAAELARQRDPDETLLGAAQRTMLTEFQHEIETEITDTLVERQNQARQMFARIEIDPQGVNWTNLFYLLDDLAELTGEAEFLQMAQEARRQYREQESAQIQRQVNENLDIAQAHLNRMEDALQIGGDYESGREQVVQILRQVQEVLQENPDLRDERARASNIYQRLQAVRELPEVTGVMVTEVIHESLLQMDVDGRVEVYQVGVPRPNGVTVLEVQEDRVLVRQPGRRDTWIPYERD